jgi:hypothetical protein
MRARHLLLLGFLAPAAAHNFGSLLRNAHGGKHGGKPNDSCDPFEVSNGQDCIGNDLSNAPAVDTATCCELCSNNAFCQAFSWDQYNQAGQKNGQCYLKSACLTKQGNSNTTAGSRGSAPSPSAHPSPAPAPPAGLTLYCPQASDMNDEQGGVQFNGNGWSITGEGRVSSQTSWNLLGGSIEWDMDTSRVNKEVNTNLYITSPPHPNCGQACYCDIQKSASGTPSCMELDLIEANGNCAMATTIHTFATDGKPNNPDCDRWGCGSTANLPGGQFHMKTDFAEDGTVTVYLNSVANDQWNTQPSAASNAMVVSTMKSIGAVIESSQWFGWAPAEDRCPSGDVSGLAGSHFEIKNVKVLGTVVQGPVPTKC